MLPQILSSLGCASVILLTTGCARPATGVEMNATKIPPANVAETVILPAATIVVVPGSTSAPLSELKTPTPAPTASAGGTVNLQNAESGVTLHVGERFLLDLGDLGWKIRVGDETIVAHNIEPNIPAGSQGYFVGLKAGKTILYATSDPPCRNASPPGMMPSFFVEIPVTVIP